MEQSHKDTVTGHLAKLSKGTVFPCINYCDYIQKSVTPKTYLMCFYWLVAPVKTVAHTWSILMGGAWWLVTLVAPLGGCCATQTLSAKPLISTKPLILCFEATILLTPSSLQHLHSEKCLWLFSCFSLKHCWHFKGCHWYELSSCQSCHFQICQNMFFNS